MSEPPSYPTVPAYGSKRPNGNPFLGGAPIGTTGSQPGRRSGSLLSVTMAVALNLVTLAGVIAFGWPAGNVFLLFWAENAVLGIITLVIVLHFAALPVGWRTRGVLLVVILLLIKTVVDVFTTRRATRG